MQAINLRWSLITFALVLSGLALAQSLPYGAIFSGDTEKANGATVGTKAKPTPLNAPADGKVTVFPKQGTAGNIMHFSLPDGTHVEYQHMSQFAGKFANARGAEVKKGEYVGDLSAAFSAADGASYIQVKVPDKNAGKLRADILGDNAGLTTAGRLSKGKESAKTNTSMVFADSQRWLKQNDVQLPAAQTSGQGFAGVGGNTGGSAGGAQTSSTASASGSGSATPTNPEDFEAPSIASFSDLGLGRIMKTEAGRRMGDADWAKQLVKADIRGLTIELARIRAANIWMEQRIADKKERIEALYATLLAVKSRNRANN